MNRASRRLATLCGGRPPLTERALAALTDRAASRLAHTLSKYVSPSVGTKCGSRPYSICRTAPDGVVMLWHGQIQQRGEKPAPRTARRPAQPCRLGAAAPGRSAPGCPRDDQSHPRTGGGAAVRPGPSTKIPSAVSSCALASRPGGFRRYNSTIPRLSLLLVPLLVRVRLAHRSAGHGPHGPCRLRQSAHGWVFILGHYP